MGKQCARCGRFLPIDAFYKNTTRADGHTDDCKQCYAIRYQHNREIILAKKKARYKAHPKYKAPLGKRRCSACHEEKEATTAFFSRNKGAADGLYNECKACVRERSFRNKDQAKRRRDEWLARDPDGPKRWRKKVREEMIAAYGGECECCHDKNHEFLTLDHIGGRTAENHPWGLNRNGTAIYGKLKKLGWPRNGYRLLCMNCNWAIRHGDICPHQR